MSKGSTEETDFSFFGFKLVYKIIIIAGLVVALITVILSYMFIPNLAESRIQQVTDLARTTSVIVSELAVSSFYDRDKSRIISALNDSIEESNLAGEGFLQISVILYPSGIYYASTNEEFINRKVGQSLLKKIELNTERSTVVEKLNYEFEGRTVPVLHFLRNISVLQKGEEKRIAVTQILFDYEKILNKTRQTLLFVALTFFGCIVFLIWLMYLPITKVHKRLINSFNQISKSNFNVSLRTRDQGEVALLYSAFNKMTLHLTTFFQEKQQDKIDSAFASSSEHGTGVESTLRKTEITCLCARIPDIENTIGDNPVDKISTSITSLLQPLENTVKEFGGQLIKILGDKVYVMFEGINSIDNSIRTALKVNQKWQIINHERKVLNQNKLDFGIGIHSAEGLAGTLGDASVSYTIIGPSAAIAEYLCSCATAEQVLTSASLMDKASGSFQHQVVSDFKPSGLEETEQALVLTNLQFNDDFVLAGKPRSKGISEDDFLASPDTQTSDQEHYAGIASTGTYDTSLPDMLEETLSSAPLGSVISSANQEKEIELEDKEEKDVEALDDKLKEKALKKKSLWDTFDSNR